MNIADEQINALKELINIGISSGADVLNMMFDDGEEECSLLIV